jgi:hypothetical protein
MTFFRKRELIRHPFLKLVPRRDRGIDAEGKVNRWRGKPYFKPFRGFVISREKTVSRRRGHIPAEERPFVTEKNERVENAEWRSEGRGCGMDNRGLACPG